MAQRGDLPRVIDTSAFFDARASEVKALQQVVAAGPGQASSQHAGGRQSRRRTTSYKPYRHTRRPNRKLQQAAAAGAADAVPQGGDGSAAGPTASEAPVASERPTSRAMRRRPGRLRGAAERSCATEPAVARQAGQLPRQLETHTWHAKRMSMQERWGHLLPEGAIGKGHGSRHVLQRLHSGCLLHDASYWCPLQLAGAHADLLPLLQALMEPGIAERLLAAVAQPLREHAMMLHHAGQWPRGAIGPARALLLPAQHGVGAEAPSAAVPAAGLAEPAAPLRLWLWLHPAAYHAALAMLQRLCRRPDPGSAPVPDAPQAGSPPAQDVPLQLPQHISTADLQQPTVAPPQQPTVVPPQQPLHRPHPSARPGRGVSITPLSSQLRRLELRGPSATAALAGLLPDFTILTSPPAPDGTALGCQVHDPRLASSYDDVAFDAAASDDEAANQDVVMAEADADAPPAPAAGAQAVAPDGLQLWDELKAARPPHSEGQINSWRRQRRLAHLGLTAEPALLSASEPAGAAGCPALLIRWRAFGAAAAGWSLVVPARWVAPLWKALQRRGVLPVGQREWRWVASDQGCAAFPWDFPDTRAGAAEAATEAAADSARRTKAIKAKQPLRAPQWHSFAAQSVALPVQPPAAGTPAPAAVKPAGGSAPQHRGGGAQEQPADAAADAELVPEATDAASEQAASAQMDVDGDAAAAPASQPAADSTAPATASPAVAGSVGPSSAEGLELAPLLPAGWWVARTAAALRAALPHTPLLQGAAAAPQSSKRADGAPAAPAHGPGPNARGQAAPQLAAAEPDAPAAAPADSEAGYALSGHSCLVRVRVRMTGRGVAEAGAAIHGPAAPAASVGSTDQPQTAQQRQQMQLIGFVMAPAVRGGCAWAAATALCSAAALDRSWQQQHSGSAAGHAAGESGKQLGIDIAVVHPTTGEHMPAQAFLALHGRAGDASM